MPRRKIRVSTARVFARQTATTKIFKLTSAAYIFILTSGRVHANIYNVATGLCCDWVWRSLVACLNGVQEAGGSNPLTQTNEMAVFHRKYCHFIVLNVQIPSSYGIDLARSVFYHSSICFSLSLFVPIAQLSVAHEVAHAECVSRSLNRIVRSLTLTPSGVACLKTHLGLLEWLGSLFCA